MSEVKEALGLANWAEDRLGSRNGKLSRAIVSTILQTADGPHKTKYNYVFVDSSIVPRTGTGNRYSPFCRHDRENAAGSCPHPDDLRLDREISGLQQRKLDTNDTMEHPLCKKDETDTC